MPTQVLEYFSQNRNISRVNDLCDVDVQFFNRRRVMGENFVLISKELSTHTTEEKNQEIMLKERTCFNIHKQ